MHPAHPSQPAHEATGREQRRALILERVGAGPVRSQVDLQRLLAAGGIRVNQGTLSRDIRDLGLLKGPHGYELPAAPAEGDAAAALREAAGAWLLRAAPAGHLAVLATPPGGANALALALDRAQWREIAGTIAGDDTVFAAARSEQEARLVAQRLLALKAQAARLAAQRLPAAHEGARP